jgi:hypothetical protein
MLKRTLFIAIFAVASIAAPLAIYAASCTDPDGTVVRGDVCGKVGGSCVCYDY